MSTNRTTLEVIAPSVEEAIEKGLIELGLQQEDVEFEILDEGSRGLFGLGSRQARVRLTIKSADQDAKKVSAAPAIEPVPSNAIRLDEPEESEPESEEEHKLQVAHATISKLLEMMYIKADVSVSFGETDENHSHPPILIDISGKDLSVLIGRRAETLNALQYIASLMIGKELGHAITLVVDVEGYRERRQNQLRQLARRMAEQAIKTGRRQVLEPMPASERRIIHIELRGNPEVRTESTGEEPHRKVNILPAE